MHQKMILKLETHKVDATCMHIDEYALDQRILLQHFVGGEKALVFSYCTVFNFFIFEWQKYLLLTSRICKYLFFFICMYFDCV